MNTSTDYSGRLVDLEVLQSVSVLAPTAVSVSSVSKTPKNVTGAQKAVQRYALVFMTTAGDVHFDTTFGTSFMRAIASGQVQNNNQLLNSFAIANSTVLQLLAAEDAKADFGNQPDDERVINAQLTNHTVDIAHGRVLLYITLTLASGDTTSFVLPTTVPR